MNAIVRNNAKCPVKGIGTISQTTNVGQSRNLSTVLYVPSIKGNLLSVAAIIDNDLEVQFKVGAEIIDADDKY